MSIQLSPKPFGSFSLQTLGDEQTHVSFVAEQSAYIHQIRLGGIDLLDNYASGEELTENNGYKNLSLLPFPNRLCQGKYIWNGSSYTFEINDQDSNSALHGFGSTVPFKVDCYDLAKNSAKVRMSHIVKPTVHEASFPFLVRFEVELSVNLADQLVVWRLSATNLGSSKIPVGIGWHPYFKMPGGIERWKIQLPPNELVVLHHSLPTGESAHGLPCEIASNIDAHWDDCFKLKDREKLEVKLHGPSYSLSLKQLGDTRYTQLYVPPDSKSIAIEPMTCGVDAFNVSPQEVGLNDGETLVTGMRLKLSN